MESKLKPKNFQIIPSFTQHLQLVKQIEALCKKIYDDLDLLKNDFTQMQQIFRSNLQTFLTENKIHLDWAMDETVSVSDFNNPGTFEQYTFVFLLERLYELGYNDYKTEDFEFFFNLGFNMIKKLKGCLISIFTYFYDAYHLFQTTKNQCHLYQYLFGVEAFYPVLSLNDTFNQTMNVFQFS